MAKIRILRAVCTIAMLAATPALAQRPEAGMTNANGKPNPEATQPANNGANTTGMVSPGSSGTGPSATAEDQTTHRPAMAHPTSMMHARNNSNGDAAVDRLNDESYQAAQKGQTFSVSANEHNSGATTMPTPPATNSSAKP